MSTAISSEMDKAICGVLRIPMRQGLALSSANAERITMAPCASHEECKINYNRVSNKDGILFDIVDQYCTYLHICAQGQ